MSHTARIPRLWVAALAAGLLSSGCILNPPAPAAVAVARQAADAFSLSGRISVSDGSQSANGRIDWQRHPGADSLTIISPLGQIVVRVTSGPEGAEAVFANGERQSAPQITDLVPLILPGAAEVGLPPERLAAWIQAAPPADAEVRTLDSVGRPARLIDQGWIIDYLDYRDKTPHAIPRLIDISRVDFRVRFVIDRWEKE